MKSSYNSSTELGSNFCGVGPDTVHASTNKSLNDSNRCVNGTVKKFNSMNVTENSTVPCDVKVIQPMEETSHYPPLSAGKFGKFFLVKLEDVEDKPLDILNRSAARCKVPFKVQYEHTLKVWYCQVYVNKHLLTSVTSSSKNTVRDEALKDAYCKLKEICYTLKIKQEPVGISVTKDPTTQLPIAEFEPEKKTECSSLVVPMADNIGSKLMKSMGWTGGGLGKDEQGIQEPVSFSNRDKRSGLGARSNEQPSFVQAAKILLQDYIDDNSTRNLVFSSNFSKEERAQMHMLASKENLKSQSYGGADRRLIISKKVDYCAIVERMLKSGNYVTEHYELIKPCFSLPRETPMLRGVSSSVHENDSLRANYISTNIDQVFDVKTNHNHIVASSEKLENHFVGSNKEQEDHIIVNEFGRFILTDYENPNILELLKKSAKDCNVLFELQFVESKGPRLHECIVKLNGTCVSSAFGASKKIAQRETLAKAMKKLREVCYSLKIEIFKKKKQYSILKRLISPEGVLNAGEKCNAQILSCASKSVKRSDLGFVGVQNSQPTVLGKKISSFVHDYVKEKSPHDLVFTADFSPFEILSIEKIISQFPVKKTVQQVSNNRYLVLSNYVSPIEVAEAMLRSCVK